MPAVRPFNYRAKVEAKALIPGTVLIRIKGLHDGLPIPSLPIAYPAGDMIGSDLLGYVGMTPAVGSYVYVFFDGGNPLNPIYFAYAPRSLAQVATSVSNPGITLDPLTTQRFCITLGAASICIQVDGTVSITTPGVVKVNGTTVLLN